MSFLERLKKDGWWKRDDKAPTINIDESARTDLTNKGFTIVQDSDGAWVKITKINEKPLSDLTEEDITIERLPVAAKPTSHSPNVRTS
jgi:hypothetical protein